LFPVIESSVIAGMLAPGSADELCEYVKLPALAFRESATVAVTTRTRTGNNDLDRIVNASWFNSSVKDGTFGVTVRPLRGFAS
jgi:hypothetical protein